MYRKFKNAEFGICPLLGCEGHPMLPIGLDDSFEVNDEAPLSVHVYCSRCQQVMLPARNCVDHNSGEALNGAFFGTTFPHLFLMQFPTLIPRPPLRMDPYVPKIFGFKVRIPSYEESSSNTMMDSSDIKEAELNDHENQVVSTSIVISTTQVTSTQVIQNTTEAGDAMSHDD